MYGDEDGTSNPYTVTNRRRRIGFHSPQENSQNRKTKRYAPHPRKTRLIPAAKPSEDKPTTKPKKQSKHRSPTPEILSEESSLDSIQLNPQGNDDNTPNTSLEWFETSISEPAPPKKRGRPPKSASATPQTQAKPRARSTSAQPAGSGSKAAPGVKGRKPKLAVVPETQVEEVSVVTEEEEEVVEFVTGPRQGSILPASVARKPSFEVCRPEKR